MTTIKIISNPYSRNLSYLIYDETSETWNSISQDSINSRLRENDEEKIYLPFKVKEIVDTIISEYYTNAEPIELIFEGTDDEFDEMFNVCSDVDVKDKIHLMRSPRVLANARDIMGQAKSVFTTVQPIIENIIKDDADVTKRLEKVSDALSDIIPICVFGNYSSGKSTFINSLIGYEILPSGGDPVTSKVYEIHKSEYEDRAKVIFSYKDNKYELIFTPKECKVQTGDKSADLIQEAFQRMEECDSRDMCRMVYETVDLINSFERRDKEVTVIGNVIRIEVPFSQNGKLGISQNKYVIFDTPGSNSNTNIDHVTVLTEALKGFSNGIPVWVSGYDSIDSVDNAKLCDKLYEIDALDKRFTMIVINKADSVELPKNGLGEKDIMIMMEYDSVEKMYSSGIYFVSSVMGLGAKNLEGVVSEYLLDVYDEKERKFSDSNARTYKKLYEYNIMPEQMKQKAVQYSQECGNLIYANSGLYCIEMEMDQFASKHSAYNKCQMVKKFLENVIADTEKRISEKTKILEDDKAKREQELDEKRAMLIDQISLESKGQTRSFERESKKHVKEYVKASLTYERTAEELEKIDQSFAEQHEMDVNYSSYERDYQSAKSNRWKNFTENSHDLLTGDFLQTVKNLATEWANDSKTVQRKKESLDDKRETVDKETTEQMLEKVVKEFKYNLNDAQDKLWKDVLNYWQVCAQTYRDAMSRLIAGTDALDEKQRAELNKVIFEYPLFEYDDQADKVFIKAKYLRGNVLGIKIGTSERLNINRLTYSYNHRIGNCITEISELINKGCFDGFKDWIKKFQALIEENIIIYNPELRGMSDLIKEEEERILELQKNKQTIISSFDTIESMMAWEDLE